MGKTLQIIYYNNGVGETKDFLLLIELLKNDFNILANDECKGLNAYYEKGKKCYTYNTQDIVPDVAIFSNNFFGNSYDAKVKILLFNEEWFHYSHFIDLQYYDILVVKSNYAKNIVEKYHKNVVCLPYWSIDMYDPSIPVQQEMFHLAGMSIQKGTEYVCNIEGVNVVDGRGRFVGCKSNYKNYYQSEVDIKEQMNRSNLHLCPSIYEAHGHYMFEGLSCGKSIICTKIPVWEESLPDDIVTFLNVEEYHHEWFGYNLDMFLYDHPLKLQDEVFEYNSSSYHKEKWLGNDKPKNLFEWPFRKSFLFDPEELKEKIEIHKNDSFSETKRKFCLNLFEERKNNFRKFILDLV
tara:strand:- start:1412 stop:2461 length:1050 start_codon:yes stop_codon:yes gene_type:complete